MVEHHHEHNHTDADVAVLGNKLDNLETNFNEYKSQSRTDMDLIFRKLDALSESINGNGRPGLRQELSDRMDQMDIKAAEEKTQLLEMLNNHKWKIIICMLGIAAVASATGTVPWWLPFIKGI